MLALTAPDAEAYDAFMNRLVAENPNVRRFTTNVALGWPSGASPSRSLRVQARNRRLRNDGPVGPDRGSGTAYARNRRQAGTHNP